MDNVNTLREAFQLWNDKKGTSAEKWLDLMADDVELRSLADGMARLKFSRARKSKKEVAEYFKELGADWEMIHYTTEEFIAEGDRVVVRGECAFRNRHTGKSCHMPKADFFRFRDGKIIEFFEFYDTAKMLAAC